MNLLFSFDLFFFKPSQYPSIVLFVYTTGQYNPRLDRVHHLTSFHLFQDINQEDKNFLFGNQYEE